MADTVLSERVNGLRFTQTFRAAVEIKSRFDRRGEHQLWEGAEDVGMEGRL